MKSCFNIRGLLQGLILPSVAMLLLSTPCKAEWTFNKLYKFDSVPNGVTMNKDATEGYVVTYDGNCYKFINGKCTRQIHVTENICQDVAMAPKSGKKNLWIVDSENILQEGNLSEDSPRFETIYKFKSQPNAVALSSNGNIGFVAEENGNIDEFINSKFTKTLYTADSPSIAICTNDDGNKIYFITGKDELYYGIQDTKGHWSFEKIHKFTSCPSDLATTADGSVCYVISSTGTIYKFKKNRLEDTEIHKISNGVVALSVTYDGNKLWITTGDFSLLEGIQK